METRPRHNETRCALQFTSGGEDDAGNQGAQIWGPAEPRGFRTLGFRANDFVSSLRSGRSIVPQARCGR